MPGPAQGTRCAPLSLEGRRRFQQLRRANGTEDPGNGAQGRGTHLRESKQPRVGPRRAHAFAGGHASEGDRSRKTGGRLHWSAAGARCFLLLDGHAQLCRGTDSTGCLCLLFCRFHGAVGSNIISQVRQHS